MKVSISRAASAWRALFVALAVLLTSAVAGPAAAQEADAERAKALYEEARALKEAGRTRDSLEKLQEAYEAFPSDMLLISIANRHLDLGEPEEAAEVLSRIVPENARVKKQVERLREDVEARLAEPVPVRIDAHTEEAEVSVDGGPFRPLPTRLRLPRGTHRFVIRAPGREEVQLEKELRGSIEVPIVVALPVETGRWRVAIEPPERLDKVRVLIEGEALELNKDERRKPVTDPRPVPPGTYKVTCLKGYEQRVDDVVEVRSGEVAVATCTFSTEVEADGSRTWAWVTAGGAAAAIVGGTAVLAEYLATQNEYPSDRYELSSGRQLGISGGLYGAGVALGITSAFLFAD
ncbi:MAG: tetratricopeptide repeat protein [Myxococcota bacterium]